METIATPILIGESGARVVRFRRTDGAEWIVKSGREADIDREALALRWCAGRLPVATLLESAPGSLTMSVLPGMHLADVPMREAVAVMAQALALIHAVPTEGCPLDARWETRLLDAEANLRAGLVDESDFDGPNLGRTGADILSELRSMPPPPPPRCFTHGDACPPNFLAHNGALSGIVDLGRAGLTHPAQDWALCLPQSPRQLRPGGGAPAAPTPSTRVRR